ncbi:arsenite methyltransferase [Geosporobacter ferrireducens]|uniref:Arsenite methyltransferase n=1 Tax=Geosporobacter ferrireducens TaxID=1424294 RepID=A0A1D8GLA4_9FIRM|nr:arsenite methyltransferase [Geosporobacter ferrireducens]AOT71683.1 arsenite S-adenosylmethyltransferase [Geosporobacter ferrireducens]MTI55455.1 arsenite methyltransferase [Geosporobacter ferrireducens]
MQNDVRENVKSYYGSIAEKVVQGENGNCGCGSSCCGDISELILYDGEAIQDLPKEAVNASLGCANPLLFADLQAGEKVLDLGSGGGIDVLMASKIVGEQGMVYGLDMTDEMLKLANKNKEEMGVTNVEFIKGYIEEIPIEDETVDVVMSNCVINLSDDKEKALAEAYRVLKQGGRLAIADIVTLKPVSQEIRKQAELWVGCIAGTLEVESYKEILKKAGFKDIIIEPVHVYTKSVIEGLLVSKEGLLPKERSIPLEEVDGAFAGAYIKAYK